MSEPISLVDALSTTRAIRRFTDDPIPDADLNQIMWLASRAPSGSNRQGFRFVVLRDGPNAAHARELIREGARVTSAEPGIARVEIDLPVPVVDVADSFVRRILGALGRSG
jgi:nitroreductase